VTHCIVPTFSVGTSRPQSAQAWCCGSACADPARFGVVDVQEAFQRSPLVLVSASRIKGDLDGTGRELKKRGRALAEARKHLQYGAPDLDEKQRAEAEARLEEETAELVEMQRQYRSDLEAAQARRGAELIAQVEDMAREVAQREGLTLLLRREGALYTGAGESYSGDIGDIEVVDLTELVARALLERINPSEIAETPPPSQ
jgi:Skp family chaperone for outer membrane proteins